MNKDAAKGCAIWIVAQILLLFAKYAIGNDIDWWIAWFPTLAALTIILYGMLKRFAEAFFDALDN